MHIAMRLLHPAAADHSVSINKQQVQLGVCDIYRLRFENSKYFTKNKQNAYRVHAYISLMLRGD